MADVRVVHTVETTIAGNHVQVTIALTQTKGYSVGCSQEGEAACTAHVAAQRHAALTVGPELVQLVQHHLSEHYGG